MKTLLAALLLFIGSAQAATVLPTAYQLFGPVDGQGTLIQVFPARWEYAGGANTAKTKEFDFGFNMPQVGYATYRIVWTCPYAAKTRVFYYYYDANGALVMSVLGELTNDGSGYPRSDAIDITAGLEAARVGGKHGYVGFQMYGDGINKCSLFEARIKVDWVVTPAQ